MFKKNRKHEVQPDNATPETPVEQAQAEPEQVAEPTKAIKPAAPRYFLQFEDGTQYHITPRKGLLKSQEKAPDGHMKIILDSVEAPVHVTSSKGWSAPDKVLEYIWINLPSGNGYITLDYNQKAADFAGKSFSLHLGKATRDDPARVPSDADKEKNRIALAVATFQARKSAATTDNTAPATEEAPTA